MNARLRQMVARARSRRLGMMGIPLAAIELPADPAARAAMFPHRQMITQYWPYTQFCLIRHNPLDPRSRPCHARITLDGITYACTRTDHTGAHDAGEKHLDGGLVRW